MGSQETIAALHHFWRKAASLTSAARCARVHPTRLCDPHGGEGLRSRWVNADKVVKVCLGCSQLDHSSVALGHLASVGTEVVEANHLLLLRLYHHQFCVAGVLWTVSHSPFQRPEIGVVHLNISLSVLLYGIFLREPTAPLLQRSEDGGADIDIVGQLIVGADQPARQQLASLDRRRGELGLVVEHVADGVDGVYVGPLGLIVQHLAVLGVEGNANLVKTDVLSAGVSANCKDYSVELISVGGAILVLGCHLQLSRGTLFDLLDALRHALADHVDAMLLHVLANLVGHLLVKTSQQNAPHHHGGFTAESSAEASALKGNVRSTNQ